MIGTKLVNVVVLLGVAGEILREASLLFRLTRVGPKQIDNALLHLVLVTAKLDLTSPLDLLDACDVLDARANTSVTAEDLAVFSNDRGKWQVLESLVNFCKDTIRIVNVFTESLSTLSAKAEMTVDVLVFVVAAKQVDLSRIL